MLPGTVEAHERPVSDRRPISAGRAAVRAAAANNARTRGLQAARGGDRREVVIETDVHTSLALYQLVKQGTRARRFGVNINTCTSHSVLSRTTTFVL